MKRFSTLLLSTLMVLSMAGCASSTSDAKYKAGTYTGTAAGKNGDVTVEVVLSDNAIDSVTVKDQKETAGIADPALEQIPAAIVEAQSTAVDTVSGATITSQAIIDATNAALTSAGVDVSAMAAPASSENKPVTYTAGTYTGKASGYNGPVELDVTFSADGIEDIAVKTSSETAHVGDVAYDIMFADAKEANGSGVDTVSGATFTSAAVREALNDAAQQAKASDLAAFKSNTVHHEAKDPIEDTWDVVIVGGGGAGMMAAAQAAQDGSTVLVIEKNAEIGGNTLVSGGAFQSVMPYLVWDPENPDATTGINPLDGKEYAKVLNDAGRIDTLRTIYNWSEEPFDGTLDKDHPFVAGDISLNAARGVHAEYLPVLKDLKVEIKKYLDWADAQMAAGKQETELPLFSTLNLHVFQTYYGGLRPNEEGTDWIYGDVDLVKQVIEGGQEIKPWLVEQGAQFDYEKQSTLIGCLWQRENAVVGGTVDGEFYESKWGAYFAVPKNTVLKANDHNEVLTRTTAQSLITEDGRVTGVNAVMYDGTTVTAHATKGVILATGGYGANIPMVQSTNDYWQSDFIADNIGTTNRSSLQGDGITMAESLNAATEGEGWTQMMPLGWVDNGNLAGGAGENVIFIDAATGKRYVDESAERDVLSEGAFEHGMSQDAAEKLGLKYVPGIYVEVSNVNTVAGPGGFNNAQTDIEGRMYFRTVEETAEMIGCDAETLRKTIEDYDAYVMGTADSLDVDKLSVRGTIGEVEKDENGHYLPDTYKLDKVRVRFMAPSTHHTMGGLKVDLDRHVLDNNGSAIAGLYAAGEVTGGIHAGNRLGGNAITEIIVSGRAAAKAVDADNQ